MQTKINSSLASAEALGHRRAVLNPWHLQVAIPAPETHLLQVTMTINDWSEPQLDLHMPVWTPGSYLVREYSKQLQDFQVTDGAGNALPWQKISKNHWRITTQGDHGTADASGISSGTTLGITVVVQYQIFCHELTVRTNHIDHTHGFFNGAATFMWIGDDLAHPYTLQVNAPEGWRVATALPQITSDGITDGMAEKNLFWAKDFDALVDHPVEVGIHERYEFMAAGKPHDLVIWGSHNADISRILRDTITIIEAEAEMFGGLPYDRYMFLVHMAQGYGGLEHENCCTLLYNRFGFRKEDSYLRFMNLVAHEFFHTWNVKRIKPQALSQIDYHQENYTGSLWFSEGTTSYYDQLIPLRAGLYGRQHYLRLVSDSITRLQNTPGRRVQSLYDSSWDTWIKLYRPEPNSPNSQISYYLKGELVSMVLDLHIRALSNNARSLDDVLQILWQKYRQEMDQGKPPQGFTDGELQEIIASVAGVDLTEFWQKYLYGTDEIDYDRYLAPFGLSLNVCGNEENPPYTGIHLKNTTGEALVRTVEPNSPAQKAGLSATDTVIAINGLRVTSDTLADRLRDFFGGQSIEISFFQGDLLRTTELVLDEPKADRYQIVQNHNPTLKELQRLEGWLG